MKDEVIEPERRKRLSHQAWPGQGARFRAARLTAVLDAAGFVLARFPKELRYAAMSYLQDSR